MPLVSPLPTPYFRFTAGQADENPEFSSAKSVAFSSTNVTIHSVAHPSASASSLAGAIERCFHLIDTSQPNHPVGYAYATGQVVAEKDSSGVPTGIRIESTSPLANTALTLGEAWSIAAQLRAAGYGVPYVP